MSCIERPTCIIAEDEVIIAMQLEDHLKTAGFAISGSFVSCESALQSLEMAAPEIAVLDYLLQDGPCIALALALIARGVPVVFLSGLPPRPDLPAELADVPWIEKPTNHDALVRTMVVAAPSLSGRLFRST